MLLRLMLPGVVRMVETERQRMVAARVGRRLRWVMLDGNASRLEGIVSVPFLSHDGVSAS
jgi:hypothetical protein